MYQDLSTHHDWPIKKAIVNLPNRLKGNLSLLGAQDKDISTALQTLLTGLNYVCDAGCHVWRLVGK